MTKKILFWLGVSAVSLLVMVRPVYAETISAQSTASSGYVTNGFYGLTAVSACQRLATSVGRVYNAVVGGTPPTCWFYDVGSTTVAHSYSSLAITTVCAPDYNSYCAGAYSCPVGQNWTLSGSNCTRPDCVSPQIRNTSTGVCEAPPPVNCPTSGTVGSSGFYDIGTDLNANNGLPPTMTCDSGCPSAFNGSSVGWRVLVSGVYHYYAQGSYVSTSSAAFPNCSSGAASPAPLSAVPTASCASGQNYGYVNGSLKCLNSDGSFAAADSASAVAAAKSLNDARIAKAIADAKAAAAAAGGSASAVAEAGTAAAGAASAGGGTSGTTNPYPPGDPMNQYCVYHPDASLCSVKTACDNNPNLVSCAVLGTVADDVPLGIKNVNVSSITPITVGGAGACPAPRAMVLHGHTYYMSFATYCNFATGIKPIILVFAWLASAGLLVGGFKTA